jgi:hypothetical protein
LRISGPATGGAEASNLRLGPSVGSGARPLRGSLAALALASLSAFSATQTDAEVLVDGGRDEIQVRVENDTVAHVLEALGQTASLRYRSAAPVNRVIGGRFSGSLEQVLSRVLAGYDFVVRYDLQGIEIFVVRDSGAAPIPPAPIEASPRPQTASAPADPDAPSISPAPRFAARKAPSQYDLWTASRIPSR